MRVAKLPLKGADGMKVARWTQLGRGWAAVGAGVALWLVIAAAGNVYAQNSGLPVWETIVTWDEWVVSVLLIPQVLFWIVAIFRQHDVVHPGVRRLIAWVQFVGMAALTTFALDLVTRALLGLGWKPF